MPPIDVRRFGTIGFGFRIPAYEGVVGVMVGAVGFFPPKMLAIEFANENAMLFYNDIVKFGLISDLSSASSNTIDRSLKP